MMLSISGPYTTDDVMIMNTEQLVKWKLAGQIRILRESLPSAPPYPPQIPHG
jgi:hypothetical protein